MIQKLNPLRMQSNSDAFPSEAIQEVKLLTDIAFDFSNRWFIYESLYLCGRPRIDLLNRHVPHLFANLQNILRDDLVVSIGRLLDAPIGSRRDENLSVEGVLIRYKLYFALEDFELLMRELSETRNAATGITLLRNKRIAHSDKVHYMRGTEGAGYTWAGVGECVQRLLRLVESISIAVCNTGLGFYDDNFRSIPARELFWALLQADEKEAEENALDAIERIGPINRRRELVKQL